MLSLRNIADAQAIREQLGAGQRVIVIGAGFIGLEIAATALALGGEVTVIEIADRPLGRAVSNLTSAFFLDAHRAFGATFRFGVGVAAIEGAAGWSKPLCSPMASDCPPTSSSSALASSPRIAWRTPRASCAKMA